MPARKFEIGSAAAVGGVAPNLLALAMYLTSRQEQRLPINWWGYTAGLLLLAGLGCLVALIWKERVPKRAFYLGMGLPAMLQIAVANPLTNTGAASTTPTSNAATRAAISLLSSSAFAQDLPPSNNAAMMEAMMKAATPGTLKTVKIVYKNVPSDAILLFSGINGQKISEARPQWSVSSSGQVIVPVPIGATKLEVVSAFSRNSPDEKLRMDSTHGTIQPLRLEARADFMSGLLRAFGRRAADALELAPVATPSPN